MDPKLSIPSRKSKIVTIFGSSRPKAGSPEYEDALLLGKKLSSAGISICTGGYGGIMEAASKGAEGSGVQIIGVTTSIFSPTPNEYVNVQVHTQSLYERLEKLVHFGDGYIILKGGTGTLVELSLVWELMNKNIINEKPILTVKDFWKPVIELLDKELAYEGKESCSRFVRVAADAGDAANKMIDALAG
ncbi:MAG TPA: LOG family protein [Candidatus Kryptonia bacterium]